VSQESEKEARLLSKEKSGEPETSRDNEKSREPGTSRDNGNSKQPSSGDNIEFQL
jgi:hypothetical protein